MSTKEWIYRPDFGAGLYQELSLEENNNNPATVEIVDPTDFCVERKKYANGKSCLTFRVEIAPEQFDHLAIGWCKKRKLQGALGGPVGKEFRSSDGEYSSYDDAAEGAEIATVTKEREGQDEVKTNLEYDNIFNVVTDDVEEAKVLKQQSDKLIKDREFLDSQELPKNHSNVQQIKGVAKGILAQIKSTQEISDEESLLRVLQENLEN
tara:strand:+ start:892 stop:1515 length:624 start_codon:yes stop_codon:yes gene_type:complete